MWRHEQLSIKMAVSCAVHHSAQRFRFDAAVQTVDFFNMSDDESNVPEYVTPAPVVEHLALTPAVHAAPAPAASAPQAVNEFASVAEIPVPQAETVEVVEFGPPSPADFVPPMRVTTPVVEAPVVVVEHVQHVPVTEYVAPAPFVTCIPQAPVVEDIASTPVETYVEAAQVDEYSCSRCDLRSAGGVCGDGEHGGGRGHLSLPNQNASSTTQWSRLLTPMCPACTHLYCKNDSRMTVFSKTGTCEPRKKQCAGHQVLQIASQVAEIDASARTIDQSMAELGATMDLLLKKPEPAILTQADDATGSIPD